MFAVIKTGGKQYRVAKDDHITVERINGEAGDIVALDNVLMIGEAGKAPTVGAPAVDKAAVFAEVVEQGRGEKVVVFKKQRRQNHRRKNGHRQDLTTLRIVEVSPTGTKPKTAAKPAAKKADEAKDAAPAPEKKTEAKKPAAKKAAVKKTDSAEKKAPAKKASAAKKAPAKKTAAKKAAPKKAAAKKSEE